MNQPPNEPQNKVIIPINPEWPWHQRFAANLINSSGVFIWLVLTVFLLWNYQASLELTSYRDALLNIVIPSTAYGILSLVAGLTFVSWLFPYFSYRQIMEKGTDLERLGCFIFWSSIAIALAIVIAGVV